MLIAENIILKIGNPAQLKLDSVIINSRYSCQPERLGGIVFAKRCISLGHSELTTHLML